MSKCRFWRVPETCPNTILKNVKWGSEDLDFGPLGKCQTKHQSSISEGCQMDPPPIMQNVENISNGHFWGSSIESPENAQKMSKWQFWGIPNDHSDSPQKMLHKCRNEHIGAPKCPFRYCLTFLMFLEGGRLGYPKNVISILLGDFPGSRLGHPKMYIYMFLTFSGRAIWDPWKNVDLQCFWHFQGGFKIDIPGTAFDSVL